MHDPQIFCLTPVKNEAWILERFLKCASLWADRIIIADQGSTDGSREIARMFPKVTLIDNLSEKFNQAERQQMLLAAARQTSGPKVLLALDADEFLSANFLISPEWESIKNSPAGTVVSLQLPIICADVSGLSFFDLKAEVAVGFVDDGSPFKGSIIHSLRIPIPAGSPSLALTEIKLMHYCLMDRRRFDSRIRWYQCFEYLGGTKRPIEIYRFYHPDLSGKGCAIKPVPTEWIQGYVDRGIDVCSVHRKGAYPWDKEVLDYFEKYGLHKFKRLAIWDLDWSKIHHDLYPEEPIKPFPDPRSGFEKLIHQWLEATQPHFSPGANRGAIPRFLFKCIHKALYVLGW
jgi:hypothetical protein